METNLISFRPQNFLTAGVFILGWVFLAVIGCQIYRMISSSQSTPAQGS